MTQYVVGLLKAITNSGRMAEYRAVAADALAKHGGKIVVPPTPPERIEGPAEAPAAIVRMVNQRFQPRLEAFDHALEEALGGR